MKNMKKVLCAMMAATTVCAVSASAFASNTSSVDSPGFSLEGAGTTKGITIALTVPENLNYTVDPYKTTEGQGQVYSGASDSVANYTISSTTAVPVKVMVTGCKGTIEGEGLKLVETLSGKAASKELQLFLRAAVGETELNTENAKLSKATSTKAGDVVVTTSGSTGTGGALLATLPATDGSAAIGFLGAASTDVLWAEDDKVAVAVALNIVPQPNA